MIILQVATVADLATAVDVYVPTFIVVAKVCRDNHNNGNGNGYKLDCPLFRYKNSVSVFFISSSDSGNMFF
jgi:hypothetical protein